MKGSLTVVASVVWLAAACGGGSTTGGPDAARSTVDGAVGAVDAPPGSPGAADAATSTPDAALGTPDGALRPDSPLSPDAGPTLDATPSPDASTAAADAPPGSPDGAPGAADAGSTFDAMLSPDASTAAVDAFRGSTLALRDPHVFFGPLGCIDVTDTPVFGYSVNGELDTSVTTDSDDDGYLDLSLVDVFEPLDQAAPSGMSEIGIADCTAPLAGTMCTPGPSMESTTYTNRSSGTCMAPYPGTISSEGYSPAITTPSGPCFVSAAVSLTVTLAGVVVPLQDVQVAATYVGDPATSLSNGLIRGFISEDTAATVLVPLPIFGNTPLPSLLPGGDGSCTNFDDRDVGLDGVTIGWWLYFNFSADAVNYSP